MARLRDFGSRGGDMYLIDPEKIEEKPGYNIRDMESEETQAHIRKMADAIKASGTDAFPAITIGQEDGKIFVYAGHCRRRAHLLAKSEGAPVKGILCVADTDARGKPRSEEERTLDMINSNDNLHLAPMEIARGIQRLISFKWTITEIARRRGVTPQTISNILAVLDLPAPAAQMVQKGQVAATLAVETVRKDGALIGSDRLKTAVEIAEKFGKKRATKKHLPKDPPKKEPLARIIDNDMTYDQLYNELISAVYRKFPNETRHQTALRYIQEAEKVTNEAPQEARS